VQVIKDAPIADPPTPRGGQPAQPGDIRGKGILAHGFECLEDPGAVALGDSLKLFYG